MEEALALVEDAPPASPAEPAPPAPKPRLPRPPAMVAASLAKIEQAIGGRAALVAALAHAPRDFDYVVGLIGDPRRARTPLATLCAIGGVRAGELIEAYKQGELSRAQALAIAKVGERLSEVAEDVMRLSIPHEVTCSACHGKGTYLPKPSKRAPDPKPERCLPCDGSGILVAEGDVEHKKLALDLGKLLPKAGGVAVNVQQNTAVFGAAAGGTLEKLQAATDQLLYGGDVPEATVVAEVLEGEEAGAEAGLEAGAEDQSNEEPPAEECSLEEDWRGAFPEDLA